MKDILIIDHFCKAPGETGNNRFVYLANMLCDIGYNVELVTSNFAHISKSKRNVPIEDISKLKYKFTMLNEPVYKKNVCLQRFVSHKIFGSNLKKYLDKRPIPDLVYISLPSLDVGIISANYCSKNNIPFIVDVQDIWPEAFKLIFNIPFISDILFYPLQKKANYIYSCADSIVSVSKSYLEIAKKKSKINCKYLCVFLGTNLSDFDNYIKKSLIKKNLNELWVTYVGTLGHSYNINIVSDAIKVLKDKGYNDIVFKVLGDGPKMQDFKNYANNLNIHIDFLGRLNYDDMIGYIVISDIAVNPIIKNAAQSIINKHGDYAAAGIPVVNTQESEEYRRLIKDYNCGINCRCEDKIDVAHALEILINDNNLRSEMGINHRLLAEKLFDRKKTYIEIVKIIESFL